jgi:hypothetical protein
MSKYSLDTDRLLTLLPLSLRQLRLMVLIRALLSPVQWLHTAFTTFRTSKEYRLDHTGQVFSLEQVICDFCDNDGCYITDGELRNEIFVPYSGIADLMNYQMLLPYDGEVEDPVCIHYEGDGFEQYADFIVHLPAALYGNIDEASLCALIDEYKLAGKFYSILYDDIVHEVYSYEWTNEICVQQLAFEIPYAFEWSREVCIRQLVEVYSFGWSIEACVRIQEQETDYTFSWSSEVCTQESTDESSKQ